MTQDNQRQLELDERFPSGEWKGFWLQRAISTERQHMTLALSFENGHLRGEGTDRVGKFTMAGRYEVTSGKVRINKFYVGQHQVLYEGWAESGKGIWGIWTIRSAGKDGFHIWPKGMADPTGGDLEAGVPASTYEEVLTLVDAGIP